MTVTGEVVKRTPETVNEDMATGEIRLSILWEWLHKQGTLTEADPVGVQAGDAFTRPLFERLLAEGHRAGVIPHRVSVEFVD